MEIKRVGVVGCGIMGRGIAQVCAQAGYQAVVSEINNELLTKGLATITASLNKLQEKGKLKPEEKESVQARIKGTTDMKDFAPCDLVIEAATEKLELKKTIFTQLDKICDKSAIMATNTSSVSVTDVASVTSRPGKVLGLHFFNPAPVMELLEVVLTLDTSEDTFETVKLFAKSIGKTVIVAKDTPAFIVNRLLIPFILNAIRMLESGVASKEDIDAGAKLGLNHPIGPLALADFIGVDTTYYIALSAYEQTRDPMWIPPVLLQKMVASGRFGRKTGKGFFNYS